MNQENRVENIREQFLLNKKNSDYVIDKTGCKMIEIIAATFIADEKTIFGAVNDSYVEREIAWYESMSCNINDIPGGAPKAWRDCATVDGTINSNYGYLIWSKGNYLQYNNVLTELEKNPESRRAVMIYTRPSIWEEYNVNGMSDFICTNAVQYFIRKNKLIASVQMRSNDVVFGFRNDKAWQDYVHETLASDLGIEMGEMFWNAGSLHVYERHFDLIK